MRRSNKRMPRPKASSDTINIEPKLPFVTPIVTFLIAGLTKFVPEPTLDVGPWGVALLVGFAAVGFCLCKIRRRSVLWRTEPGSPEATVKQSIATLRVLVSITMVIVPLAILATSEKVLGVVPKSVEQYLERLDPQGFNGGKISVTLEAQKKRNALLFVPSASAGASAGATASASASAESISQPAVLRFPQASTTWSPAFGDLYILQTDRVVDNIVKGVLPGFHWLATLALILAALFVAVIFFMEIVFDLQRQPNRRKKS
jgi:hypothetical protein